ncbi:hypothetical protein COR50_00225 [Chitinophaga caeni]|uniref:Uncharacterized protein n=2 Tax=Chitinophaga caeni TaxID=2029983 RepID=A0A291QP35_9BACT|nr:hypothetical protein COR50_00225 [Chitinophaga caeni]
MIRQGFKYYNANKGNLEEEDLKKNMKKWTILISISLVIVAVVIWKLATFEIFEVEEIELSSYPIRTRGYILEIRYLAAGATTRDVVQVRKKYANREIDVVKNIEGYNVLVSSYLIGDSLLHLVVKDTGYFKRPPDTIVVKL